MSVSVRAFGDLHGERVDQYTLVSDTGVEVDIITYGVAVRDWRVPVGDGKRSVVLGFDNFPDYVQYSPHFGCLAGRVANRIAGAAFDLDGETVRLTPNWKDHTLHGGPEGLGHIVWDAEADASQNSVTFTHFSPDGHMGFPGNVSFTAQYTLTGNKLRLDITATTDQRTPINVVQHQYFNLGTGPDVLDHTYQVSGDAYTELGKDLIPTGKIVAVDGTAWDLRQPRTMRDAAGAPVGYDGNIVLRTGRDLTQPVAMVTGPDGALGLKLWTDRPGLQVYNSVTTNVNPPGGRHFGRHSGFCLEDQDFPDAVHHPNFPSIICGPDQPYRHWCEIEIA